MKNINEFAEELITELKASSPALSRTDMHIQTKLLPNDVAQTGICILPKNSNVGPLIHIDEMYQSYQNGLPIASLAGEITGMLAQYATPDLAPDWLADFDNVKDRIVCRLVPGNSARYLSDRPNVPLSDTGIRIIWDILLPENTILGETCTTPVTDRLMGVWDTISTDTLYTLSLRNTPRLRPVSFTPMANILARLSGKEPGIEDLGSPDMYVLTNTENCDGAAVILYPETQDFLTNSFPDGCCLIPSSRHEWIVIDRIFAKDAENMHRIIQEVNASDAIEPEDVLSDELFEYKNGCPVRIR